MDITRIDDNLLEKAFQAARKSRRHHSPHASICPLANLGYQIVKQSIENHQIKLAQCYAQNAELKNIGEYLQRWHSWCQSILNCCMDETDNNNNSLFPCNTNQGDSYEMRINQSCIP